MATGYVPGGDQSAADVRSTGALSPEDAISKSLQELTPRLGMMGEQLRQTSTQIEEAVVEVCDAFQDIATRATSTVARTTAFLHGGSDGSNREGSFERLVASCDATLARMMHAQSESAGLAQQAIERLRCVDGSTRDISGSLQRMEDIARGNKILALNAQIEAARSGEYGGGFKAVAIELSSQTDLAQQVTELVAQRVDTLRLLADSTMNDLKAMHDQTAERMLQSRQEVETVLLALRETHQAMQTMFLEVNDAGAGLARDIGQAIRGMQFQDRVGQRIAHVIHDLDVIQQKLPEVGQGHAIRGTDFSSVVMYEERAIYGIGGEQAVCGDVELF